MSSAPTLSLSIRKRGSNTWVDLDPATEQGARLLRRLGLVLEAQHPTEGNIMTAAAATTQRVAPLRPVGETQQERFAYLLRARERATQIARNVTAYPMRALRRIISALHLDSAYDAAKKGALWLRDKATIALRMMGLSGMLGLGAVTVSTGTGRKVFANTVGRALVWTGKGIGWGLGMIKGGLRIFGKPGNWAADRIEGAQDWAAHTALSAITSIDSRVGKHLATDSTAMRVTRLGGVLLVAQRLMTAFGLPMPVVYLIGAATAFWGVYDAADVAIKVGESRGWLKVTEDSKTGAKTATADTSLKVATPGAAATTSTGGSSKGNNGRRGR